MKLGQQWMSRPGAWLSASKVVFRGVLQCQCFLHGVALIPPSKGRTSRRRGDMSGVDVSWVEYWRVEI